jgi:hypothetical protein
MENKMVRVELLSESVGEVNKYELRSSFKTVPEFAGII